MLLYHLAESARIVISRVPACFCYPFANIIGDVVYYGWPRGRRNMQKSAANILNLSTDDPEVRRTARRGMRNFCKFVVDVLRFSYPEARFFREQCELSGRENLDAALKEGKGIVLVSFHLGNLDMGIRLLSSLGYPVNAIVDNLGSGQLEKFIQTPRVKGGVNLFRSSEASSRLLEVLRRNEILALMIDCPNCTKGVKVKLGQKWVKFPSGAAVMALRTGARLIPCGLIRTSNTTFRGIIGKPVEYQASGNINEDIRELTQRTIHSLEDIARAFLDQWYVFHPLIKDDLQDAGGGQEPAATPAN